MTKQLEDFLTRYCESFRAGNIDAAADFYHEPATMIFADRMVVLHSRELIAQALERVLTGLITRGFSRSVVDELQVIPLTDRTALISAAFSRLRSDGEVLERLGATYTVIGGDRGFKIAAVVTHGEDRVVRAALT